MSGHDGALVIGHLKNRVPGATIVGLTTNGAQITLSDISVCTAKNDISGYANPKDCDLNYGVPLIASDAKFKLKLT